MASSSTIIKVHGIPIRVHITLWLVMPLFVWNLSSVFQHIPLFWGLIAAIGLFGSVALHELGHGLVSISKGCRVREILLLPIGGVAQLEQLPRSPKDEIHIAIAGPLVSLLLAVGAWQISKLFSFIGATSLNMLFMVWALINLMLTLFNLIPSFPMDGGRIFRAWMSTRVGRLEATRISAKMGKSLSVVFGIWSFLKVNPMGIAIAVFIYLSANAEYKSMQLQQESDLQESDGGKKGSFHRALLEDEIVVSPSPYKKQKESERKKAFKSRWPILGKFFKD